MCLMSIIQCQEKKATATVESLGYDGLHFEEDKKGFFFYKGVVLHLLGTL